MSETISKFDENENVREREWVKSENFHLESIDVDIHPSPATPHIGVQRQSENALFERHYIVCEWETRGRDGVELECIYKSGES